MKRWLLLSGSALLLIFLCSIVLFASHSPVKAANRASTSIALTSTPTLDATQLLTQANNARDKAIDAKNTAQEKVDAFLSYVNYVVPVAGLIIALISGLLVFFGFNTQKAFKETQTEYRNELKNLDNITTQINDKKEEIEQLKQDLEMFKSQLSRELDDARKALALSATGDRLFDAGKRDMALEAYLEAKRLLPSNPDINYRLGRTYSRMGRYNEAIEALEEALANNPNQTIEYVAYQELGLAYRRRGDQQHDQVKRNADYELAIRYLQRAIKLNPKYEDALAVLGGLYKRLADYPNALAYYQRAASADQMSSYALGNVASIQWHEGYLEASNTFKQTEEVATKRIQSGLRDAYWDYYDRALARIVLKRKQEALADYQTAIRLTPSTTELDSVLNNLYFLKSSTKRIDELDEVITLIEEAIRKKQLSMP